MSRSATTGIYTRVSNSFSQPVVGTTIDPSDADTFFDDVEASMNSFLGTSTTSLAIGTGAKTFTMASPSTKVFVPSTHIHAFSLADSADYMDCTVTSYDAGTGALVTDCFAVGGSGTNADWVIISAGARGPTGATGATGATSGILQTYSSTTTDADPGAGTFRLNNATPASATAAYLDNLDSGGSTVSAVVDLWDDSTSTVKGLLRFEKSGDAPKWAQFQVTGSVVDGTGYRKLTLANGQGSGAFTDGDVFAITFTRSGDAGTNGAVAINGTPALNQLAVWHDATTAKGIAITGIVKGNGASAPAAAVDGTDYLSSTTGAKQGKQTIFIPAAAMRPRITNGPSIGAVEMTTNKNMVASLDFDTTTQEFAQFSIAFPKSWDRGTVTFMPYLSQLTTAAGNVVFSLAAVAVSSGDALDVAFGGDPTSDTTVGTANLEYIGPESSAVTIAGSPAVNDRIMFQISRAVSSDNLAQDARLHGIRLFFTTNAATDT